MLEHDFTPPTVDGIVTTPSIMVYPDPSDSIHPDHLRLLGERGVVLRAVPGADHTIWYGHLQDFIKVISSS